MRRSAVATLGQLPTEHPFFADLDASHFELSAACASNVVFEIGDDIFHEGDAADQCYIILQGEIAVQTISDWGAITVQTLSEGDILGWSCLIPPHRWRFDARAQLRTRAIAIDGECLRTKCEDNHELGYNLLKRFSSVMAQRLEGTRLQLMDAYAACILGALLRRN